MPTDNSIPYADATQLDDILTDDQKKALKRLNVQQLVSHLEKGRPAQMPEDIWPKVMRANLPVVAAAISDDILFGDWLDRANTLVTDNAQYLQPETPAS